nr:MAG TPA: hypothetical protein [Caudoviricetes sp.]
MSICSSEYYIVFYYTVHKGVYVIRIIIINSF